VAVDSAPHEVPPPGRAGEVELAALFVDIARRLQSGQGTAQAEERIVSAAVATVDGCEHAGISLLHRSAAPTTVAATDDVAALVDELQYEFDEGPCLDAIRAAPIYRTGDLAAEVRWPRFGPVAVERTGVRSVLALRLFLREETAAALNLYSRRPAAFDDHALAVGAVLAGHAALVVEAARQRRRADQLGQAIESNRDIGVAIGILMAQHKIPRADAFELLVRSSQWLNRKLRDIATEVGETGELPVRPPLTQSADRR
jgi:hypothetical protein